MIELIASNHLVDELRQALVRHPGIEEVLVSRRTLRNALAAALEGRIDTDELTAWASLVELHNDEIVYEVGFEQFIATLLFRLATPELNEPVSLEVCRQMIGGLRE